MRDKVLDFCRREQLFSPGEQVVCALSGGGDSVALLHLLLSFQEPLDIRISAAHFNHCLRGEASDGDEAFVRRLCASWGVPLAVGRGDVRAYAARTGTSPEEAARVLRYDFLRAQPGVLATAHHGDDQVETVLLNLLRGTGLKGLGAMAPRQGNLVRPLLAVSREEILAYLRAQGLSWREDHTNDLDDALRNRLRHHVIPLLEAENPNLTGTVRRMTDLLRADEAYLEAETEHLLHQAARGPGWDCGVLAQAPAVLRRRAIRALLPCSKPSMAHVEAVEALLHRTDGSQTVDLPGGFTARREYALLVLEPAAPAAPPAPEVLRLGETRDLQAWGLEISISQPKKAGKIADSPSTFQIKYDRIKEHPVIQLRSRQPGDRLQLPGGGKSLKRLMIDRKIPARLRDTLPVLTCGQQLLAVYGLGPDCTCAAQPGEPAICITIRIRGEKQL